jgi:hypothetical protein
MCHQSVCKAGFKSTEAHGIIVKVRLAHPKAKVGPEPWVNQDVVVSRLEVPHRGEAVIAKERENLAQGLILEGDVLL